MKGSKRFAKQNSLNGKTFEIFSFEIIYLLLSFLDKIYSQIKIISEESQEKRVIQEWIPLISLLIFNLMDILTEIYL